MIIGNKGHDGVVSVFPDPVLQLHTTRSWDFLESELGMKPRGRPTYHNSSTEVIVGVIDTGKANQPTQLIFLSL